MYNKTLSKTIAEATDKLFAATENYLVFHCPIGGLTSAQIECFGEYFYEMGYSVEEMSFAADYIYVNLSNDHIYVLEICDGVDDTPRYYYEELFPTVELLQDQNGNLYYYEGVDEDTEYRKATIVEKHGDRYINTSITVYMTDEEFTQTTRIVVEMR